MTVRARNQPGNIASQIIRLDLSDTWYIKNVTTERSVVSAEIERLESEEGPAFTTTDRGTVLQGEPEKVYTCGTSFYVDVNKVFRAKTVLRQQIAFCAVTIDYVANPPGFPPERVTLVAHGVKLDTMLEHAMDVEERPEPDEALLYPVYLETKLKQADIDRLLTNLTPVEGFVLSFELFIDGPEGPTPMPGAIIQVPFDLKQSLMTYYAVQTPVTIAAAPVNFSSTMLTIRKKKSSLCKGVKIYKRKIQNEFGPRTGGRPFSLVADIDFLEQGNTGIDEFYEMLIIDGTNAGVFSENNASLDNSFQYQYRAVPVGPFDAPELTFYDTYTTPIGQGHINLGEKFSVLPVFESDGQKPEPERDENNNQFRVPPLALSNKVVDFYLKDDNFLSPGGNLRDFNHVSSLVSNISQDGTGVSLTASGLRALGKGSGRRRRRIVSATFLRKNLTIGQANFGEINDPASKNLIIGDARQISYIDKTAIDATAYEYAVKTTDEFGISQINQDTSQITFNDKRLLPTEGIRLEVTEPTLQRGAVSMQITINVPQNIFSLISALLSNRTNQENPFISDIIAGRENLAPQPALVVKRSDLESGEEFAFKMTGPDASKFTSLIQSRDNDQAQGNQAAENAQFDALRNQFRYRFTDDTVRPGARYTYEIIANLRDPLSLTAEVSSIITGISFPYAFQACKFFNPVFVRKGILPPTPPEETFISQENIDNGPRRLLNRFTPDDEFDLGVTAERRLVPVSSRGITIPRRAGQSVTINSRYVKRGMASLDITFNDPDDIDGGVIFAQDTYLYNRGGEAITATRTYLIGKFSGQRAEVVRYEFGLEHLLTGPNLAKIKNEFGAPNEVNITEIQAAVDQGRATVTRTLGIRVLSIGSSTSQEISAEPITIVQPSTSSRNNSVSFVFNPASIIDFLGQRSSQNLPQGSKDVDDGIQSGLIGADNKNSEALVADEEVGDMGLVVGGTKAQASKAYQVDNKGADDAAIVYLDF